MKKYLVFTVIAALFMALPTQAQFKWGVKAGVNLSGISTSEDFYKNSDNYTGFQLGPMMEFTVPLIGVGMDAALLYSQTGFKVSGKTVENGNLLLPVNLKYKLSFLDVVGAYAAVGPYIGVKMFGPDKSFDPGSTFDPSSTIEKVKSESFGAGLNFGLGVELLGKLQIGANYQLGLTDDYKSYKDASLFDKAFGQKSRVWSITAAYFF